MLPEPAQDDHGQHADGLHEREGFRADESTAGGQQGPHGTGEGCAGCKGGQFHLDQRNPHGDGGSFILANSGPGAPDLGIFQAPGHIDDDDDHDQSATSRT